MILYFEVLKNISQNVVPEPAPLASPGNGLNMQILRPILDLLNQKHKKLGPVVCSLTSSPGDFVHELLKPKELK